jgi:hypothetical protein
MLFDELIQQFEQEAEHEQMEAVRQNTVTQEVVNGRLKEAREFLHRYFATKENLVVPDELLEVKLDSMFDHQDNPHNYLRVYLAYNGRKGYAVIATKLRFNGEWKLDRDWDMHGNDHPGYFPSAVDALRHAFKEYGPTITPEEVDKLVYEAVVAFGRPVDGGNISAQIGVAPYLVHSSLDRLKEAGAVVVKDGENEWVDYYTPANPTPEYLLAEFPQALKAHQAWVNTPAGA